MRNAACLSLISLVLLFLSCCNVFADRITGDLIEVKKNTVVVAFPVQIQTNSMLIVLSGDGEAVAGMAIAEKCIGAGPCEVRGRISFVSDAEAFTPGKKVYVNSANIKSLPSSAPIAEVQEPQPNRTPDQDLKLYYYAAGQNVSYGALGIGYERTVWMSKGVGLELDAGVTGTGNLTSSGDSVNTDNLIKSASGKLRFDVGKGYGFYAGYRWNEGRGDDDKWGNLADGLGGKPFADASARDSGTVELRGIEYGITLRPLRKMSLSLGFIPEYRADYGGIGVRSQPGYLSELRFGGNSGAVRLRGILSDDYWQADLGITIR